jgi:hypothetical protein
MRLLGTATIALVLVVNAACASMTASAHIERGIRFDQYVTYQWEPPDNLPVGDPRLDNNPFYNDYLQGAIEKGLAAKGYQPANGQQPDVLIHYHASVTQKVDVYRADTSAGYYYEGQPQVTDYELGTLVIDMVDARTKRVVWRGWAQDTMTGVIDNQERLEKQVDEGVGKMMALLPRGGAALR